MKNSTEAPTYTQLIPPGWKVPEVFRQRLGKRVGKQRLMQADGHLLLILHAPPQPDQDTREARLFWRDADGNWMPKAMRHGATALGELLQEYKTLLDELEVDEELANSSRDYFEVLRRLTPLQRTINNVHRVLQEARQAQSQARELIYARDTAYALSRQADLLLQQAQHALDFEIARQAELQAESARQMALASYRLNILAAFFFPLVTIAGIFGMNFPNGLEDWIGSSAPWPLLTVIAIGLALGGVLTAVVTRRSPVSESSDVRFRARS